VKVKLETWAKMNEVTTMLTDKQMAKEALDQLPETASFREIKEELEIVAGLKRGLKASEAGQIKTSAEVKEMVGSWFTK
jgi:predicted transcriptional regulator